MSSISASVIADSISPNGVRLTTFQVTFHRWILAEVNTHRMLSRNYRSSRAVPAKKLIEEVRTNPAMPIVWSANQKGMQGGDELSDWDREVCKSQWFIAANSAANSAELLMNRNLHKSRVNRILEPYLYVHGVITATDWANFFALRRHSDAEPEFIALANAMWDARETSKPVKLSYGEWHLPYISEYEKRQFDKPTLLKVSAARCARVSYKTFDGTYPNLDEDLKLYDKLMSGELKHASPTEHQATPAGRLGRYSGNFWCWEQHRKTLDGECVPDTED